MIKFTWDPKEADNIMTFYIPATQDLIQKTLDDPDIQAVLAGNINTKKLLNDAKYGDKIVVGLMLLERVKALLEFLNIGNDDNDIPG